MVNRYYDQTIFLGTTDDATKYAFNVAFEEGHRLYRIIQRPSQEGDPDRPFAMDFPFGYLGMGSAVTNRLPDTYSMGKWTPVS